MDIVGRTAAEYARRVDKPFTHIVVDGAQNLGVAELRFLSGIASLSPDALSFAGDLGQRIFQQPFSEPARRQTVSLHATGFAAHGGAAARSGALDQDA